MRAVVLCLFAACGMLSAQTQNLTAPATIQPPPPAPSRSEPIYRVTVISRTTKAINYGHLTEPTKVGIKGTVLLPEATGEARVTSRRGATQIDAKVNHLEAPTRFGPEYLTYVLWAITPEGRAMNLGELVADPSNKAHVKVATDLQAFALIITAEPYYSVLQPSDVVVMENFVRPETVGKVQEVDAKYELMPRKQFTYDPTAKPVASNSPQLSMEDYESVLALYQALNALQIAKAAGAERYAADTYQKAVVLYKQASDYQVKKLAGRQIVMTAREAAQTAEDARAISAKRQQAPAAEAR
jgi:hypothetical protein